MRRALTAALVLALALGVTGSASAALRLARVAGGFTGPIHAASAPGDARHVYVVEQRGLIKRVHLATGNRSRFLDIRSRVACCGERGLLSVAFHPNYETNRRFFVNYTRNDGDVVVARFRANDAGTRARVSTSARRLLVEHSRYSNHNGGTLFFTGRCGLHVSIGDGGSGGDPHNNAQRRANRLGKLVKINICRGRTKIVAFGLRNPWRVDRDPETGIVYVADVGQGTWEEISLYRPWRDGIENYGWSHYEGDHVYDASIDLYPGTRYVRPIHEYEHTDGRCSITGGVVHRNSGFAEAYGRYFYGDFCTGEVWSFRFVPGTGMTSARQEAFSLPAHSLVSFGRTPSGGAYVVNRNGVVSRIAAG